MKLLKFLVYSNLWIASGAFLITYLVFSINGISPNFDYLLFIFFSTLFSYNLQRITRLKQIRLTSPNSWIIANSKWSFVILILSLLGALATLPIFNYPFLLLWIAILGIISAGYSYKNLRELPYLKIVFIALSWAIGCGLIPVLFLEGAPVSQLVVNTGWVFFYILAITIPFDIRDIGIDHDKQKTIPQWIGIPGSKLIGIVSLGVSFLFLFLICSPIVLIGFLLSFVIAGFLIRLSFPDKEELYFSFLVDGHIILQFLLLFFLC